MVRWARILAAAAVVLAFGDARGQDACAEWVAERSWAAGRIFWVDAGAPRASDRGPGTVERPWRTAAPVRTAGMLHPGDAVVFRPGIYPTAIRPASPGLRDDRITFAACPGGEVIITGLDPIETAWTATEVGWQSGPIASRGDIGGRHDRHLLTTGRQLLRPVKTVEDLAPGAYVLEPLTDDLMRVTVMLPGDSLAMGTVAETVGIGPDPTRSDMRIARRGTLFGPPEASSECPSDPEAGWYRLIGLTFEHAANPAQSGAVCLGGSGVIAEDITVRQTNGLGIRMIGEGHQLLRSRSVDNGQAGIGGHCVRCRLEDVRSDRNNWRGHDRFWEAGGGKWMDTSETTFIRYSADGNDGVGLWFDGDSRRNEIIEADIRNSELAALMFELRSDSNRVSGGRFHGTRYRGWSGSGILVQAAGGNVIEGAEISGNAGKGIWVRSDGRVPTGGITVLRTRLSGNLAERRDGDYEISIEQDIDEGDPIPPFEFEGVVVRTADRRLVLGVARHRRRALSGIDPALRFGPDRITIE